MEAGWPYATFGLRLLASNTRPAPPSLALASCMSEVRQLPLPDLAFNRVVLAARQIVMPEGGATTSFATILAACYHCCLQALVPRTCASPFSHGKFIRVMDRAASSGTQASLACCALALPPDATFVAPTMLDNQSYMSCHCASVLI